MNIGRQCLRITFENCIYVWLPNMKSRNTRLPMRIFFTALTLYVENDPLDCVSWKETFELTWIVDDGILRDFFLQVRSIYLVMLGQRWQMMNWKIVFMGEILWLLLKFSYKCGLCHVNTRICIFSLDAFDLWHVYA